VVTSKLAIVPFSSSATMSSTNDPERWSRSVSRPGRRGGAGGGGGRGDGVGDCQVQPKL